MEPPFALPTQVELWYLDRYSQAGPALSIATAWRLTGPVDVDALSAAVDALEARHESLRCHFEDDEGVPRLRPPPAGCPVWCAAVSPSGTALPGIAIWSTGPASWTVCHHGSRCRATRPPDGPTRSPSTGCAGHCRPGSRPGYGRSVASTE